MVSTRILYHEALCPASAKFSLAGQNDGLANGHYAVISLRGCGAGRNLGGVFIFFYMRYRAERLAEVIDFAVIMLLHEANCVTDFEVADEVVYGLIILARDGVFNINHNDAAGGIGCVTVFRCTHVFHVFADAEARYLCSMVAVIRAVCREVTAGDFDSAEVVRFYCIDCEKLCVFRQGRGEE